MVKRLVIILVVMLTILAFSNLAWSTVRDGTYDISGTMTTKISIKHYGSQTSRGSFSDEQFTFYYNGDFEDSSEEADLSGTWSQKKSKFTVYYNPDEIVSLFVDNLSDFGDVSVEVTSISCSGTEKKDGSIKGSMKMNMTLYLYDYDLSGKVKVSGSFTGYPAEESLSLSDKQSKGPESFMDVIGRSIRETIQQE